MLLTLFFSVPPCLRGEMLLILKNEALQKPEKPTGFKGNRSLLQVLRDRLFCCLSHQLSEPNMAGIVV